MPRALHDPEIFEAPDLEKARFIILTPQGGQNTDERWARETPYLTELIGQQLDLKPGQLVIDYGCGIGRLAKTLIERFDVRVLGVDDAAKMRGYAPGYVPDGRFSIVSRVVLLSMVRNGLKADAALAVWVLQHCLDPGEDLDLLKNALKPGSGLLVVNNRDRVVPARMEESRDRLWLSDGLNVRALLTERFDEAASGDLDGSVVGSEMVPLTFWATYRSKAV